MKFIVKLGKSEKDIRNLRQEIEILRTLKHENIIQMLDTFETKEEFCVVTEFAQGVWCHRRCFLQVDHLRNRPDRHRTLQVNYLRFLRMIRVFQSILFRMLPSSWCVRSTTCITTRSSIGT